MKKTLLLLMSLSLKFDGQLILMILAIQMSNFAMAQRGHINDSYDNASTYKEFYELDDNGRRDSYDSYWIGIIFGEQSLPKRPRIATRFDHNNPGSITNNFNGLSFYLDNTIRMQMNANGKIGVGVIDPTRLFDIGGALRVRSGGINGDPLIDLDASGSKKRSRINSEGPLALAANDKLTGNNSLPHLLIDLDGSIFITGGANLPSVSSQTRSKYSLFVQKGLLSENYGLAPQSTWADYVFKNDYELMPLDELLNYISKYKHLPNMPSESKIAKDGYSLHEMNLKLTEKIEELTLYTIKQQKELDKIKKDYKILLELVKPLLSGKAISKIQENSDEE
ncbi:MAG: hypothetical protein ACWIPJ_03805 [Polaribacter sp.]